MTFNWRSFPFLFCALVSLCEILAAPEIRHFVPHAVVPGVRTVLTFSGSDLDKASNLWTSFNGNAHRIANTNEDLISFAVTCPADITGIQALQISGPEGASNFQLFMVDALQTSPHHNNHQQPGAALQIIPPVAVDCILKPEKIDYYRLAAKSGARFSIEVIAHRIGSQMDPAVRVLDPNGQEISFCDDDGGVWRDARFEFHAPTDGHYTLAVQDIGFGGGNAYDYRLRVTTEPLIWFTFPLADPNNPGTPLEQIGLGTELSKPLSPANPSPALLLSSIPQLVESEPNNNFTNAQPAIIPSILHGRIQNAKETDHFRFEASKDEKLIFQSQTRSAGSPCDLVLTLRKPDGTQIAQSDLSTAGDAAVTNKFSEAGPFHLEVRELSGNVTPNAPYRIKVQKFIPGFSLSTDKNIINLKPGESTKLKINAVRHDFSGPIQLRLESPIAGISLEETTIPEKKNEVELKIIAADTAEPGDIIHSKLIGSNSEAFSAPVSTRPALRESFPLILNPPPMLENLFIIAVRN
jgi:hypothetical protein